VKIKIALLRVGIDTGCGGILGPLFGDGTFDFVPIPGHGCETYRTARGRYGKALIDYFPDGALHDRMRDQTVHRDPDFERFTYGDPSRPKVSLHSLEPSDLLVFYAGLKGWGWDCAPALYIVGYFDVLVAGFARDFSVTDLHCYWQGCAHAGDIITADSRLVLVKGTDESRLLTKATRISAVGQDSAGRPLHVLSPEAQEVFGDFDGKIAIQRSPVHWVADEFVEGAAEFMRSLE